MRNALRHCATAVAVFAGAFIAANAAQYVITSQGWLPGRATADHILRMPSFEVPATITPRQAPAQSSYDRNPFRNGVHVPRVTRLVETPVAPWTARAGYIRTALLVDGAAAPVVGDQLALPSGSRFRLQVTSGDNARVEVHAVNPQGVPSAGPLWASTVMAGEATLTPDLRLEGIRGMETLRVLRHSLTDGTTTEQQVQIWHQ